MSYSRNEEYSLNTAVSTTPEIQFGEAEYGTVYVPAGSSINSLAFYGAPEPSGTFLPLYVTTTAQTLTVAAGRAYAFPDACKGCRSLKIVVNAAGTVDISVKG